MGWKFFDVFLKNREECLRQADKLDKYFGKGGKPHPAPLVDRFIYSGLHDLLATARLDEQNERRTMRRLGPTEDMLRIYSMVSL